MNLRPGQKVVCIDDSPINEDGWRQVNGPEIYKGGVYTIREIFRYPTSDFNMLRLVGMICPIGQAGIETGYLARRFRPAVEGSTDTGMAILRKVADDASKKNKVTIEA